MFGVPKLDSRLPNKAEVLALRVAGSAREPLAVSADFLRQRPVYHDRIGRVEFDVLTDTTGANRVYPSGERRFVSWNGATAIDSYGGRWAVSEAALTRRDGAELARLRRTGPSDSSGMRRTPTRAW
jgi:hypothetical protein